MRPGNSGVGLNVRNHLGYPLIAREMAALLLSQFLGREPWVSSATFCMSEIDTMMSLHDVSKLWIAPVCSHLLKRKSDAFNKWVERFTGKKRYTYENDIIKVELWSRYDGATAFEEYQYRVWYTPKRGRDDAPYFWLGERAEAA